MCLFHLPQSSWVSDLRRRLEEYAGLHCLADKVPKIVLHLPSNIEHSFGQNHPTPEAYETEEDISMCHFSHQDTHDILLVGGVENNSEANRKHLTTGCDSEKRRALNFSGSSYSEDSLQSAKAKTVHTHIKSPLFFKRRNKSRPALSNQTAGNKVSTSESSTEDKFQEHRLNYNRLKERFSQLHSDYHNLIGLLNLQHV